MHIQEYKSQETLTLFEPDDQERSEDGSRWFILLFLSIFYIAPVMISVPIVFGVIWYGFLIFATWSVIFPPASIQQWSRLSLSKDDCLWEWRVGKEEESGSFSPQDVESFSFELSTYQGASEEVYLILCFSLRDTTSLSAELTVDGIETRDEVLDFAKRIAQILNIPWGNIDTSDPLNFTLSFDRAYTEKTCKHPIDTFDEPEQTLLKRKHEQDDKTEQDADSLQKLYEKGEAKRDARLANIITTPWDPKEHTFIGDLVAYKPEKLLVFEHKTTPFSLVISAAKFGFYSTLFMFVGVYVLGIFGIRFHLDPVWPLKAGVGIFCLCSIWNLASWKMGRYPPERWTFVFGEPSLTYEHGDKKIQYPLDKATGILFERTMTQHTRTTGTKHNRRTETYYTYNGITYIAGMPGHTKLEVCETGELTDSALVYDDGIAFAGMLSNTLGLPLSFEDEA